MATRALITRRKARDEGERRVTERLAAETLGASVEMELPSGTVVSGEADEIAALEAQGYRVKLLEGADKLTIGAYEIDVGGPPPAIPAELSIPSELAERWRHHLVQLAAPPTSDLSSRIEAMGVDVVEPVGLFGLFVDTPPGNLEALRALDEVAWAGPFEPAYRVNPNLEGRTGRIEYVSVGVYPPEEVDDVRRALEDAGALIVRWSPPAEGYVGEYTTFITELDADRIPDIARRPGVRWLEYASPEPGFDGEREVQIVAENLDAAAAPNTAPTPGYQAWLGTVGLSGAGVSVAICDTGVDQNANNNASGHLDVRGRQVAFVDYTAGAASDTDGHGTHVAGIAVGNAASTQQEGAAPNNFLWGQGVAPGAGYVTQNALAGPWPPADFGTLTADATVNSANVMNNSWTDLGGVGAGYTANSRRFDQLVRDPDDGTAALETLIIVFSAGNSGPNPSTITAPKETKNPIVVGNSLTFRPGIGDVDDIRGIRQSSSRGPAIDGRTLPNVVAPGTNVSSAWAENGSTAQYGQPIAGTGTPDPANPANMLNQYMFMSGTSMASPHVAGSCALLVEWWRNRTGGRNPSPALVKALLVNGAENIQGGPSGRPAPNNVVGHIPNNDQGWGRVSLENILLQAPASDRGPRIFSDQRHAFTANGQEHTIRVAPVDPARPLRVTLVWTDAPGAAAANPALVNDLDLEVTQVSSGTTFKGNAFSNGFSTTGGTFDSRNNVECVYLQNPSGVYEVTVIAANITANARPPFNATLWQDFALVIENAEVPATAPVAVTPVLDRSGSMQFYGYVDTTRTSSKQFVDLLGVNDELGVVSFGDTGVVEFPSAPGPIVPISGQPVRDAARTEIDGIAFGGCTFMGDGILEGRDLLATSSAATRAMVLMSDGYDNKGCDQGNPAKPSAVQATAMLPAGLRVYSCAMGPTADQALLEQIASATGGRYYFMPAIDDLFEIYNYIRGQVTGDGIIANESGMASTGRVAAVVERLARRATFTVAWANEGLRLVPVKPRKRNELAIRLRDPGGRLLHPDDSLVRRMVGDGYAVFDVPEPAPGRWHVEIETMEGVHTRYTVGGFVDSPLRLVLTAPSALLAGAPLDVAVRVLLGKQAVTGLSARASMAAPRRGVDRLQRELKDQLARIRPPKIPGGDSLPKPMAQLVTLRDQLVDKGEGDVFARVTRKVAMRPRPGNPRVVTGRATATAERGSRNVVVTVTGSTAKTGRYVRKDLASVLVR